MTTGAVAAGTNGPTSADQSHHDCCLSRRSAVIVTQEGQKRYRPFGLLSADGRTHKICTGPNSSNRPGQCWSDNTTNGRIFAHLGLALSKSRAIIQRSLVPASRFRAAVTA